MKSLKSKTFTIRWDWILIFSFFWCYGWFSAVGTSLIAGLAFTGIFLILNWLLLKPQAQKYLTTHLTWGRHDAWALGLLGLLLLALTSSGLGESLYSDEIYHAERSQLQLLTALTLASKREMFSGGSSFRYVLFSLGLPMCLGLFAVTLFLFRARPLFRVLGFSTAFIALRIGVSHFGGYTDPHPPLRLLPLWIGSSLFSSSSLTFRTTHLFCLIVAGWGFFSLLSRRLNWNLALSLAAALCTMPVVLHAGTIVEFSIWTFFIWTTFLILISTESLDDLSVPVWATVFAIGTLMRQTIILGYIPLLLIALMKWKRKPKETLKECFGMVPAVFLVTPFFMRSLVVGTPSTGTASNLSTSAVPRVISVISSGELLTTLQNHLFLPWLILLPLFFLLLWKSGRAITVIITVFFVTAVALFCSVSTHGTGRYFAEFAAPFAGLGLSLVVLHLDQLKWKQGKLLAWILTAGLLLFNTATYSRIYEMNQGVDQRVSANFLEIRVLSEFNFPLIEALREAKKDGYAGSTYIDGSTYGTFLEILAGFSIQETLSQQQILRTLWSNPKPWVMSLLGDVPSISMVAHTPEVRLILIASTGTSISGNTQQIEEELTHLGWLPWGPIYSAKYGATVRGFRRPI